MIDQDPLSRSARIAGVESDVIGIDRSSSQFGVNGLPRMTGLYRTIIAVGTPSLVITISSPPEARCNNEDN